jgi:hypothetical protein
VAASAILPKFLISAPAYFQNLYLPPMDHPAGHTDSPLSNALTSARFVLLTQQQLIKDFGQHSCTFEAPFAHEPFEMDVLVDTVQAALTHILEKTPNKWLPLMYTLDISEKKYIRFFSETSADWLPEFAWIVIRREAQKVFFREKFRD